MLDQTEKLSEFSAVDRVVGLFPGADPRIVSSLSQQDAALRKYLAEHNDLTGDEVDELLAAFVPMGFHAETLRVTA